MILGDPAAAGASASKANSVTIDDIFRAHARRRPLAPALIDAANREGFTEGAARRLTYAEADRAVAAMATRLRQLALPADSIIAIQLPNIVENILVMLAAWRAGMIVATLPLLCRRMDAATALERIGAKALITCSRVGAFDHGFLAMNVGVRFKGEDKTNVDEYCVSEGWVKLAVGKTLDRRGKQLTIKLQGPVEPYFRDEG